MRFSLAYQLAIVLVHGNLDLDTLTEASLADPEVRSMAEKIDIKVSSDYEALLPDKFPALVKVWPLEGDPVYQEIFDPLGGPGNPLSREDLLEKFVSLAVPVLGRPMTLAFLKDFASLVETADVRPVFKHLTGNRN